MIVWSQPTTVLSTAVSCWWSQAEHHVHLREEVPVLRKFHEPDRRLRQLVRLAVSITHTLYGYYDALLRQPRTLLSVGVKSSRLTGAAMSRFPIIPAATGRPRATKEGGALIIMHGPSRIYDRRPSHPYNAGTEHVGFLPTRPRWLTPSEAP